ncbi:MAG: hypothetical protein NTY38_11160 [Acidobacteria bacterium]|nr:hypothetical protein [Acidobacteriota bacterium]
MPRNYNFSAIGGAVGKFRGGVVKDPRTAVRIGLGVLLAANLVAAFLVFHPLGGSPEDLEQRMRELRQQVRLKQGGIQRTRLLVETVEKGRDEGDQFMKGYFMNARTVNSAIYSELKDSAEKSGLKMREHTFGFDPIEGSNDLSMLTISGSYEGTYQQLVKFVNLLDRSPRLLIIEMLQAQPQQQSKTLSIGMKLNAFVKEPGGGL